MKPKVKYAAIYKHRNNYPISVMCRFFGVSRSGYYSYTESANCPDKDAELANLIKLCHEKTNGTYGYRRIKIWIERNTGTSVNHKAVLRVMNKSGMLSQIRRKKKYQYYKGYLHRYDNILNRNFHASQPNEKWVTDISYIHTKQGILYLSIIKDLYDNSIVSYKTGTEQYVNLVLETIREAKQKEVVTTEVQLHSDQGFQYTSHGYFNLTKEYGIIPSMSRRGNCLDNSPAENFFGILKSECINRVIIETFNQARQLINDYIHFYNHERIQLKTKLTPFEKRYQLM